MAVAVDLHEVVPEPHKNAGLHPTTSTTNNSAKPNAMQSNMQCTCNTSKTE
jgi:hypothetical protein